MSAGGSAAFLDLEHPAPPEVNQRGDDVPFVDRLIDECAGYPRRQIVRWLQQDVSNQSRQRVATAGVPEPVEADPAAGGQQDSETEERQVDGVIAAPRRDRLLLLTIAGVLPDGLGCLHQWRKLE